MSLLKSWYCPANELTWHNMNTIIKSRMPGVYFQAETPLLEDKLPRMDVAAFVGFAASGPLDVPVPIEDEVRFKEIFGEDVPLAWDEESGATHYGYLGQAVRSFFLNGGRRCWVVRVANSALATSNRFLIPGVMKSLSGSNFTSTLAIARSEGSWSDDFGVGTTLLSTLLYFEDIEFQNTNEDGHIQMNASSPETVEAGDLLRFDFRDESTVLFLAVDKVESIGADLSEQKIEALGRGFWFQTERAFASPPDGETVTVRLLMPQSDPTTLTENAHWSPPKETGENDLIYMSLSSEQTAPRIGSLLELRFEDESIMLLSVNQVRSATQDERGDFPFSPPQEMIVVSGKNPLWPNRGADVIEGANELIAQGILPTVERLTFEMWVRDGEGKMTRLGNLGFLGRHTRFLGNLPTDEELFRPLDERGPLSEGQLPRQSDLWTDAGDPRLPLAISGQEADVYLPIGMESVLSRAKFSTALGDPTPDTALTRNGLTNFGAGLFLDTTLDNLRATTLEATAFHKRHVLRQKLEKVHAILPLEEVTLLSVPDAVHPGWEFVSVSFEYLPALTLVISRETEYTVSWTKIDQATKYVLQEAVDAQFTQSVTAHEVEETTKSFTPSHRCPRMYYYRVRAERNGEISPWSNTVCFRVPQPTFDECDVIPFEAPTLKKDENGRFFLEWSSVSEAEKYTLQEAIEPAFNDPISLYEGTNTFFEVIGPVERISYYRVRAEKAGELSPWSITLFFQPDQLETWQVKKKYNEEDLVKIHRALLRMSMARGDVLSILTLPRHYREIEALAHKKILVSTVGNGEGKALSYGALYHPWTFLRAEELHLLPIPPDGPVSGSIAARAISRGAWVAPANEFFEGVLALTPTIGDEGWSRLYHEQVNLIRREPQGFVLLSADTLSTDAAIRPINVRRLLILLRRIALREGMALVFEPNTEDFRDLVQRTFESVLSDLYVRGAFAGDTPEKSYQVVTDSSVNTPTSLDQGRFIAELRVAPSQTLAFITVRLVQSGSTGLLITEV